MGKIADFFSQKDKLQHIIVSALLVLIFTVLFHINMSLIPATLIAGGVSLFCGIGKEVFDSITDGVSSWADIIADLIGIVITVVPLILLGL